MFAEYIPQVMFGDNNVQTFVEFGIMGLCVCWLLAQCCFGVCRVEEEEEEETLEDTAILERSDRTHGTVIVETTAVNISDEESQEEDESEEQDDLNASLVSQHVADDVAEKSTVNIVTPPHPTTPRELDTPPKPLVLRRSRRLAQQQLRQQSTVLDAVNAFIDNDVRHNKLE